MKKIIHYNILSLILFGIFNSNICFATDYYNPNTGNHSNTVTSPALAWQTLAKVNSYQASLNAGDRVLFERGGVGLANTVQNLETKNAFSGVCTFPRKINLIAFSVGRQNLIIVNI